MAEAVRGYLENGRNLRIGIGGTHQWPVHEPDRFQLDPTYNGPPPVHFGPRDKLSRTHHAAFPYAAEDGHQHVGVKDITIGCLHKEPSRKIGNLPRTDQPKHVTAISKYLGHVTKKGPGNTYATRWNVGNEISYQRLGKTGPTKHERAVSSPAIIAPIKSLKVPARVPGTMTHQPGVAAESVSALPFGAANEKGQQVRENNPFVHSKWFHRDPKDKLKYSRLVPGSQLRMDLLDTYLDEECKYASLKAMETRLPPVYCTDPMSWTKYTVSAATGLSYDPGNKKKENTANMKRVGFSSHYGNAAIEQQRWQRHMYFARDPGPGVAEQKMFFGTSIQPW